MTSTFLSRLLQGLLLISQSTQAYSKFRQSPPCPLSSDTKTAITNVRVFDGDSMSEPRTVTIDGCNIGDDPSRAQVIDGSGMYLLPGLIESHAHPSNITHLERAAEYGITTVMSLACPDIRDCLAMLDRPGMPDLHTAGHPAITHGSTQSHFPGMDPELFVSTAGDAKGFVSHVIASGAEYVKIVAGHPDPPSIELISALVQEADARGYKAVAHVTSKTSYLQAMQAGASMSHHIAMDTVLEAADVEPYATIPACPTLSMMKALASPNGHLPGTMNYTIALENMRVLHAAGVPILAGTDVSPAPVPELPNVMDGGSVFHTELELMIEAGMSELEVLRAATVVPAKQWGFSDRGEVRPGMRADLLLLRENPLEDIRATRSIERVWFRGQEGQTTESQARSTGHEEL